MRRGGGSGLEELTIGAQIVFSNEGRGALGRVAGAPAHDVRARAVRAYRHLEDASAGGRRATWAIVEPKNDAKASRPCEPMLARGYVASSGEE